MAHFNSLLVTGDSRFLNPINGNARNGVYYVKGTQTASTGAWTGNIPVPALYDGLTIMYYLPYAGSGNATLNLTLSNGTTTGAKNCYYSTSRLTTQYAKGCNIIMTYHPAGTISVDGTATTDDRWITNANYDTDTKVRQTLLSTDTNRPLLMSYAQTSSTTGNVDNVSYRSNSIYANPSTGNVQVTTLNGYTPTGVWVGTQAQYDAIATPDPNVTYYITDGVVNPLPATNISYSNTSSGLSATTVQNAIDEVNSSTQWIGVDTKMGSTAITLPSTWTELFILCQYGNSSAIQAQCVQTNIIRPAVETTRVFTFGGATLFAQIKFASETSVSMIYFGVSATDYTSTSQIRVYAKTA